MEPPAAGVEPPRFDSFYEVSFPGMLARALLIAGNREDAEDAVQEAYRAAWQVWDRIGDYDAPDASGIRRTAVGLRLSRCARTLVATEPKRQAGITGLASTDGSPATTPR